VWIKPIQDDNPVKVSESNLSASSNCFVAHDIELLQMTMVFELSDTTEFQNKTKNKKVKKKKG
jgi:hypothetical protein